MTTDYLMHVRRNNNGESEVDMKWTFSKREYSDCLVFFTEIFQNYGMRNFEMYCTLDAVQYLHVLNYILIPTLLAPILTPPCFMKSSDPDEPFLRGLTVRLITF